MTCDGCEYRNAKGTEYKERGAYCYMFRAKPANCQLNKSPQAASEAVSAELALLSGGLVWSKEPPRVAGWYWTEDHHGIARVQHVVSDPQDMRKMTILENTFCGWRHKDVVNMGIKWAGPISRPTAI